MVAAALLAKPPESAKPSEIQVTTAEAGRPIPVIYGRCKLSNSNITWWGDMTIVPITKKTGGFFGIGAKTYTLGFKYEIGMQAVLCWGPIYGIHNIYASDTAVPFGEAFIGSPFDHALLAIDANELFGGDEKGGGLKGGIDLYFGLNTQLPNPYLATHANQRDPNQQGGPPEGTLVSPGFPGLCYAVLRGGHITGVSILGSPADFTTPGFYIGTAPYPKNFSWELSRYPTMPGLGAGVEKIGDEANPACMIYDMKTNNIYGGGISPSRINIASFIAVAILLKNEGAGMSWCLDGSITLDEFETEIKRTCNLVCYTDPETGLWTLAPIRADYDVDTIPVFTMADFADGQVPEWTRGSWADTFNAVKINYCDRSEFYKSRVVQAIESANFAGQGERKAVVLTMRGVMNKTFAQTIAGRELRSLSYPVAMFSIPLNRKAWALREGSVFKLNWIPPEGPAFVGMVLRVTKIKYGTLEKGIIKVDAAEDIFSVGTTAYIDPDDTGWNDEVVPPAAPAAERLLEVPFQILDAARWVFALASKGDPLSATAKVFTDDLVPGSYSQTGEMPSLTPSGPLKVDYSYRTAGQDAVGFTVDGDAGIAINSLGDSNTDAAGLVRGDNLALIDNELVSWQTCVNNDDGTFTFKPILRGVMDTVPVTHSAGARVWFISQGAGLTEGAPYTADKTVNAKILPENPLGTFPIATAAIVSLATASRSLAPNPPGKMKVKTFDYSTWPATIYADADFTWAHRNRVTIGSNTVLINQDAAGPPYTIEGNLTLEILVGGTVVRTYTAQTGTSDSYTAAMRGADDTDGTKAVQIRISPINGSYNGTVRTVPAFIMTGAGMCAGNYCGGLEG